MNTNPYLMEFYNHYDEDQRLVPKHGSVDVGRRIEGDANSRLFFQTPEK